MATYQHIALLFGIFFLLVLYFLPTIIAFSRYKRNVVAILVLNILAGWTFVGWVIAIVWAFTKDK